MIINLSKKTILSHSPFYATSVIQRARGLIGRKFDSFDAMIFERCNTIHTFFMTIEIDVIFINSDNQVCDLCKSVPTWKPFLKGQNKAFSVIEMRKGSIFEKNIEIGDIFDLKAETNDDIQKVNLESPYAINIVPT